MEEAIDHIFAMCDSDKDGFLNERELQLLQQRCRYSEQYTLRDLRKRFGESHGELVTKRGMTRAALHFLLDMNVKQGRSDLVWRMLHGFGFSYDLQRCEL